jgi:TolA-binding protein
MGESRAIHAMLLLAGAAATGWAAPPAGAQTDDGVQRQLDELRQQIERQQRTIGALEQRLQELQGEQSVTRQQVREQAEQARANVVDRPLIVSSSPRLKVALSGQVNRLVNLADDGKSTKAYFVDNNISVSRLRFTATGRLTDDLTAGTDVELAISPNNSADVSQIDEDGSQRDEFRKVEALFES